MVHVERPLCIIIIHIHIMVFFCASLSKRLRAEAFFSHTLGHRPIKLDQKSTLTSGQEKKLPRVGSADMD